jgi:hypothetical protein
VRVQSALIAAALSVFVSFGAEASVIYTFQQTSFTPSPNAFGNREFTLTDTLVVTDAEFASKVVNRAGNGFDQPGYNLTIGADGSLSGRVNGLLSDYNFNLSGTNGSFSGTLVYGDAFIPACASPGCTITGTYAQVPEPVSMSLLGVGLFGLAAARHRTGRRGAPGAA